MTERTIFVFPGQGAQYIGMGKDLFHDFAVARYTFEQVSDLTHRDIAHICFDGAQSELNLPENTSLATFAHSVAIAKVLESECGAPLYEMAYAMAGHSMGQYTAAYCVGSMKFEDAVSVLHARSTYMTLSPRGGMGVIIGLALETIEKLLVHANLNGYVDIANYNACDQFVISGQDVPLNAMLGSAIKAGARVAKRLNVSIPAHCALMARGGVMLREKLSDVDLRVPRTNWFSNQTADLMWAPDGIKDSLVSQMTNGVRWAQIMDKFPEHKITRAYELGPGRVLSRLITRANVGTVASATDVASNVRGVIAQLGKQR